MPKGRVFCITKACSPNRLWVVAVFCFCPRATARDLDEDEGRAAPPLGQLVWNPLPPPVDPTAERVASHGEAANRVHAVEGDPAPSDESCVDSEEEEEESEDEAEVGRERARSSSPAGGALGGPGNNNDVDNRRHPWEEEPPSPVAQRNRTRRRAATDVVDADGDGVQASRRVSSAHLEPARRPAAAAGWFERVNGIAVGGYDAVPSAERLVASILQASDQSACLGRDDTIVQGREGGSTLLYYTIAPFLFRRETLLRPVSSPGCFPHL